MILNKRSFIAQNPTANNEENDFGLEVCVMLGLVGCVGPDYDDARIASLAMKRKGGRQADTFFVELPRGGLHVKRLESKIFAYYRAAKGYP